MDDRRKTALAVDAATGEQRVPDHPDLQRLLSYWASACGTRPFPRRADIDPVDFSFILGRISLTEVHEGTGAIVLSSPRLFRFRLVGSWWRDLTGQEMTGLWAHDIPNHRLAEITVGFYEKMLSVRRPIFTNRDAWIDEKRYNYQILTLPLSEDGERISMIMTGIGPNDI